MSDKIHYVNYKHILCHGCLMTLLTDKLNNAKSMNRAKAEGGHGVPPGGRFQPAPITTDRLQAPTTPRRIFKKPPENFYFSLLLAVFCVFRNHIIK